VDKSQIVTKKIRAAKRLPLFIAYESDDYLNSLMGETIPLVTTAIRTVQTKAAEVVSRQYFSLDGRRLAAPRKGICIVRQQMGDGTTQTKKVTIR
jgi:hypothetical protein